MFSVTFLYFSNQNETYTCRVTVVRSNLMFYNVTYMEQACCNIWCTGTDICYRYVY